MTLWDTFNYEEDEGFKPVVHACSGPVCQICNVTARPYAGSSGWSGSDTSRKRADTQDATGSVQQKVMAYVLARGLEGATWKEAGDDLEMHHGTVSGALSVLHKVRRLVRLTEARGGSKVYVHPTYTNGRLEGVQGRAGHVCSNCGFES
jgi:hypothetical protein